jgi:signal transduction histidine kinase
MISFKAILGLLFILLIAAIAVLGFVCYQGNRQTLEAMQWVDHTHRVIEKVDAISVAYKDVELTKHARAVGTFDQYQRVAQAEQFLLARLNDLKTFTHDNREQQVRIDSLEAMLQQWIGTDTLLTGTTHHGTLSGAISHRITKIKSVEEILLRKRAHDGVEQARSFRNTLLLLLFCIAALLVSTFFAIRYNFNKRMRVQEELRRSNILFEKVFYESPIAIVISEFETGEILNCNSVFAATVNYGIQELIGKTAAELGIFSSPEQRKGIVAGATVDGAIRHTEVYIRPRDRDPIYISIHAHRVKLYDRNCLLTAIMDLSSHKRAEEETQKALQAVTELSRLKSDFVTLASHEFRTPLTTILSSAFLLENYSAGEAHEKIDKHLARIKSSVSNLTSILDEFLSVTKIEEGKVHPNLERIHLPQFLDNIRGNLQSFAKQGQTIHYKHAGDSEIWTDPVLLANIVRNLVTNSIKYSPEHSPILIESRVDSRMHLTVSDKGIGISKEDQKHLFERFYRASNAGNAQGTGLGLHIMKHYVEMLKGSVKLESELGRGTAVEVILALPE